MHPCICGRSFDSEIELESHIQGRLRDDREHMDHGRA